MNSNQRAYNKQSNRNFFFLFIAIALFVFAIGMQVYWLVIPSVIIIVIFISRKWHQHIMKADPNNYYTVGSYCPNCSHFNDTHYLKGQIAYGNTIHCNKCGMKYKHNR